MGIAVFVWIGMLDKAFQESRGSRFVDFIEAVLQFIHALMMQRIPHIAAYKYSTPYSTMIDRKWKTNQSYFDSKQKKEMKEREEDLT